MSFISHIKEEFQVIQERDPAIKTPLEVLLYPSFRVMIKYRRAHKLYLKGHYFLARWISQRAARKTGIEIHPGATIGKGLFIDHGSGVIIGETTIIGDNVTLYQGVTLGGNGKETGKRHPTLEDNVMVSAGAKIIGSFTVGANSKIGAGSVVIEEVPPNCTVVGIPGRVVRQKNMKVPRTSMDHCHLPDPVLDDLKTLQKEYTEVTNRLLEVEKELRFRSPAGAGLWDASVFGPAEGVCFKHRSLDPYYLFPALAFLPLRTPSSISGIAPPATAQRYRLATLPQGL